MFYYLKKAQNTFLSSILYWILERGINIINLYSCVLIYTLYVYVNQERYKSCPCINEDRAFM